MLEMFGGDTWTGISNLNPEVLPALGSLDAEFAHGAIVYHSLTGIIEDISVAERLTEGLYSTS